MLEQRSELTADDVKKLFEDVAKRFQETDKEISRLADLFEGQWGRLVEAIVTPGTAERFRERGVNVKRVYQRAKSQSNGKNMEIDILAENNDEVVIIEVKTTLKVDDVRDFLERIESFLEFFPKYREYRIYGAMAGVNIEGEADRFAYRQGLFVLGLAGDGLVKIMNDMKFKPKDLRETWEN
jgi:hypothetical protein